MTSLIPGCNMAPFRVQLLALACFWQFVFPVFKQIHRLQRIKEARQWRLLKVQQRRNRRQKEFLLARNRRRKVFLGLLCAYLSRGHTVNRTVWALPRQSDLYAEAMNLWTYQQWRDNMRMSNIHLCIRAGAKFLAQGGHPAKTRNPRWQKTDGYHLSTGNKL